MFNYKYLICLKNTLKESRGMTLVEVLLSITILGILAVLIAGVFTNGLVLINIAGNLDRTGYNAALVAENAIGGLNVEQVENEASAKITGPSGETIIEDITLIVSEGQTVFISFPGKDISVSGKEMRIISSGENEDVTIEVFIPQ